MEYFSTFISYLLFSYSRCIIPKCFKFVQQVGPTANYSFPDYSPVGTVTGLVVTVGGTGYSVSDSLTLAELPGWSATVATVSSGVITSITFTASSSPSPLPTTIAAMSAIGGHGTGAKLGGQFIVPQRPQWLTELNRLRNNLWNVLAQETNFFSSTSSAISGPWPIPGPSPKLPQPGVLVSGHRIIGEHPYHG